MNNNPDDINTGKKIYDRWSQVTKNLPIEIQEQLEQLARPLINFVHSATFSLEISGESSMEKAAINMQEMMSGLSLFSLVCFFAGLESQYHESKGHSVKDGQISGTQFTTLTMQMSEPIAKYMIGLMKIFFSNEKALKELASKTNITTEQQYIVALTDAVTDVSNQAFELGKNYLRENASIERLRQSIS